MKILFRLFLFFCAPLFALAQNESPKFKAEHVVMIVWDGMRPDFATAKYAPNLGQLVSRGVFFAHHHSVFPTSTEVNGTALATGMYPLHSGVMANTEYRPAINSLGGVHIEHLKTLRAGDAASRGKYLLAPTVAEILHAAGVRTAVAGTKPVALLHDRADRQAGGFNNSPVFFGGKTLPENLFASIVEKIGARPEEVTYPNVAADEWTTRALTEFFWREEVPKFSVLWLSDPDFTQHKHGPGSPEALQAIASVDKNLGVVLRALEAKGVREKTDVFIVSDHGFSNVTGAADVTGTLKQNGIDAAPVFSEPPKNGQVLVVGNGGEVSLYVIGHERKIIERIVEILQRQNFSGVIATREPLEGTFTLEQLRLNTPEAPDVVLAMHWTDTVVNDTPGGLTVEGGKKTIKGGHASMSRFEIHNTLLAAGPDFREGFVDENPSGNVDVAPTILAILGVRPPQPMDGRVLYEAMQNGAAKEMDAPKHERLVAAREIDGKKWTQYLLLTKFAGATYLDEGDGQVK